MAGKGSLVIAMGSYVEGVYAQPGPARVHSKSCSGNLRVLPLAATLRSPPCIRAVQTAKLLSINSAKKLHAHPESRAKEIIGKVLHWFRQTGIGSPKG